MVRILLTAFEPYDPWPTNASWLALIELTRDLPPDVELTTRLYPVDLSAMKKKLSVDLKNNYDFVLHIGQAAGSSCIQLEEIALNVAATGQTTEHEPSVVSICESGPVARRTTMPVRAFARSLRDQGIPARVSFHAGTSLCNAILYWSCQLAEDLQLPTKSAFIHVPLATSQVIEIDHPAPFMPTTMVADALRLLIRLAVLECDPSLA